VDGLAQQVGEGELRILPSSGVRQILFDQCSEPQPLVEFAHYRRFKPPSEVTPEPWKSNLREALKES
jgi:hypothetical protein